MAFFTLLLWWIGSTVVSYLLSPRVKSPASPQPSSLGDFTIPTAEEGRCIPVAYGTVKIGGANCVWYGDLGVESIKKEIPGGIGGPKHAWTGFRYYMGEQLVLCHGLLDEVLDIRFDDKPLAAGSITVEESVDIVFGNVPPPWYTATLAAGSYADNNALALAAEDAMIAAFDETWKVFYGYHLIPNRSDEIVYSVKVGGVATDYTVKVSGVYFSGTNAARALQLALNGNEIGLPSGPRVTFWVTYDRWQGKFTIRFKPTTAYLATVEGVYLRGIVTYSKSALAAFGWQMGYDYWAEVDPIGGSLTSNYGTWPTSFVFAFGGIGGVLRLSNVAFTAATLFGLPVGEDKTIGSLVGAPMGSQPFAQFFAETDKTRIVVNQPELFGGEDREGGIVGTVDVYHGTQTQLADDYLMAVLGVQLPAYRGVAYAVFRHLYIGTSPYPKPPAFVVRRCPNGLALGGGEENIAGDANPACMLYDLMTDTRWGLGIPSASIDTASFTDAAATLYDEGLGLSMLLDTQGRSCGTSTA
jgi:hypothetical protein